ncbi:MAG: Ltp family lipoprotein [Arcanobacterium sp.]|nr:Ltp family lipoprotein [Arcanobacterium sp.]
MNEHIITGGNDQGMTSAAPENISEHVAGAAPMAGLSPESKKMPLWKKLLIGLGVLIGIAAIGSGLSGDSSSADKEQSSTVVSDTQTVQEENEDATEVVAASAESEEETEDVAAEPEMTLSQRNAIRQAESYLDFSAFSKSGLIDQLEFEGYSKEDATFAVENITVDWNEQAAKSAENYLEFSPFSRQGLIDQLMFEGFSQAEAEYGVNSVGL